MKDRLGPQDTTEVAYLFGSRLYRYLSLYEDVAPGAARGSWSTYLLKRETFSESYKSITLH